MQVREEGRGTEGETEDLRGKTNRTGTEGVGRKEGAVEDAQQELPVGWENKELDKRKE